ncbi:MarR family winged helix-turn-helix transcriptional regulator [Photobacterium andalusiense]|uniref:Transcriptional regulator SlyA n=1 Tax=Photobacterium andalusiense TaxID=2204296 RepID=A0A1Y6MET6_9GAMM|nr:MarR family transcriptional regulator [Photobacterium andalusiense]SMY34992.1 Transcriptional regulator SlyA [Photobacterium andalusiense]
MTKKFERLDSFGWLINVLASQATKELDHELKPYNLTAALWPTMMCLWEQEGITQRDIAAKAKVENSTTTRTLDKLEKLGMVERKPDPNSRRSYHIYLTEKGRAMKPDLEQIPLQVNKRLLSHLSVEEQQILLPLLAKMVEKI